MGAKTMTTHVVFEQYDRRFARAMASLPERRPWMDGDRAEIKRLAKKCLGIRDEWIPDIRAETVRAVEHDGFSLEYLRFTSWPGVYGAAHLYLPRTSVKKPLPFVMLCCGHGGHGKLYQGYQAMARHIARRGAMVLVADNIGQGERRPMGHADALVPFACGTSLQGLIVLEALGWLRHAACDRRVDRKRMAAIGNSGGGTLTMFLAALSQELAALSSSGYPSTFEFVARKEKKHCACNIIPKIVGALEMWHLYGCFAPRPLFIFQGAGDRMFPPDIFYRTARKVAHAYAQRKAGGRFKFEVVDGAHSWDAPRNRLAGDFLAKIFKLAPAGKKDDFAGEKLLPETDACFDAWPAGAITAADLARRLTGVKSRDGLKLWDIFPPARKGAGMEPVAARADPRVIMAQFEAFLKPGA